MRGSRRRGGWWALTTATALILAVAGSVGVARAARQEPGKDELKRTAFFGARVVPVPEEDREALKLEEGIGTRIEEVVPGATAESAGFQAGDVLLAVDDRPIAGPGGFVEVVREKKAGESFSVEFRRGEITKKESVTLKGRPPETSETYDIEYGSVASKAGRLRTIVTRPRDDKDRHPALFLIQGIGTFTMENPSGFLDPYKAIIDDFTGRGFVTLRVDKPGCGDSEGGPARDVDFDTEMDGYLQGLRMLKKRDDVDPDRVYILGHSMGGVFAPLLAEEEPVRGIIVYGTLSRTWVEYLLENTRRQMELAGASAAEIDSAVRADAALWTHLCVENMTPEQVVEAHPNLRERTEELITDGVYFVDRTITFFQQLASKNLGGAWESFEGDVLAVWGKGDFVSNQDDHALIARIVNRNHPGHGTFVALEGSDHGFQRADSTQASFSRGPAPGEFNPAILEVCRDWIEKTAKAG